MRAAARAGADTNAVIGSHTIKGQVVREQLHHRLGAGAGEPASVDSPLAINLASVNYYSRQWTFVDQTKHGGGFGYAASPGASDEQGWILSGDVGLFLDTGLDKKGGGVIGVLFQDQFNLRLRLFNLPGQYGQSDDFYAHIEIVWIKF